MTSHGNSLMEYTYFSTSSGAFRILVSLAQHPLPESSLSKAELADSWDTFLADFFNHEPLSPSPLQAMFEPLRNGAVDSMLVVGQLGQTIDGRIATVTGHSKYINGLSGLTHLHQLRALLDAVVVGVGTVLADDPQLNVRLVRGRHPARVVIDPRGRLSADARIWLDDGARRIWIVAEGLDVVAPAGVEMMKIATNEGRIEPAAILRRLSAEGLNRILIEGGAETVSRFSAIRLP